MVYIFSAEIEQKKSKQLVWELSSVEIRVEALKYQRCFPSFLTPPPRCLGLLANFIYIWQDHESWTNFYKASKISFLFLLKKTAFMQPVQSNRKKLTWRLERSSNNKSFILSYLLTPENQKTQSHKGTIYIRPSYFILLCAFALPVACKNKGKLLVLLPF